MPQNSDPSRIAVRHTLTQADFDRFATLSGDHNPIHVDPDFAAATPFGATVSHGMLLFSLLRGLIARHYPGTMLASQELMFPAPSYANETLTLVLRTDDEPTGGPALLTEVHKEDGRLGLQGRCVLAGPTPPAPSADAIAQPTGTDSTAPAPGLQRFLALAPGDTARLDRTFTGADVAAWATLAGHPSPPDAIPEPLIAALFSCLLGEQLPGHGTNYLKQTMRFHQRARIGEALSASVTVTRLRPDKALVDLHTRCTGDDDRLLCSGNALVLFHR